MSASHPGESVRGSLSVGVVGCCARPLLRGRDPAILGQRDRVADGEARRPDRQARDKLGADHCRPGGTLVCVDDRGADPAYRRVHARPHAGFVGGAVFLEAAERLAAIPGVEAFEILAEVSPKNDYRFGISMEFADRAAYDGYNQHEDHVRFVQERWMFEVTGAELGPGCASRRRSVLARAELASPGGARRRGRRPSRERGPPPAGRSRRRRGR